MIASVAQVTPLEEGGAVAHDAGTREATAASDGASDGASVFSELDDPEGCVVLADQSIPEVIEDGAVPRLVVGRTGTEAGCVGPDAGVVLLNASVFRRRDNKPLVEEGVTYSYRWDPATTITMTRVNLVGGDSICDSTPIVQKDHGLQFVGTGSALGAVASCYEFTSPIESMYVRLTGGDYIGASWLSLGKMPLLFKLCPAKCPPNTEHFFEDAAVPPPQPYWNDAGMYVIPGITAP